MWEVSWWQQGVSRVGNKEKGKQSRRNGWMNNDFKGGGKPEEINLGAQGTPFLPYDLSIRGGGWWNTL